MAVMAVGASNVVQVFTYWTHLSHKEIRALLYMALHTYDISPKHPGPPVFFRNWKDLSAALGAPVPTDDSTDAEKKRNTLNVAVSAVRKALVDEGALIRGPRPRPGVKAEFALALDPTVGYSFSGSGRGIQWTPVRRQDPRPFPEAFVPGAVTDFPHDWGLNGYGSHLTTGYASHLTTGNAPDITTGYASDITPGTTTGLTQEYREEEGEPQATHLRAVTGFQTPPPEEDPSFEAEKQHQMRELMERQAAYEAEQGRES